MTDVRAAPPSLLNTLQSRFGAYLALTKPRVIELLLVTTVPTMVVAEQGLPSIWLIMATVVGGALAAGGANTFNMYIDRDIDALMERTKHRPLVTGSVSPRNALIFGTALEAIAFALLWGAVNLLSAVLAVSAMAFYIIVYTLWLKRTSRQNIVIGGAAGAVPALVGWSAVTNGLAVEPWLLFLLIFLWTPPHFWALAIKYADDYRAADIPMLPAVVSTKNTAVQMVIYTVLTAVVGTLFGIVAGLGWIYGVAAAVAGVIFLIHTVKLLGDPTAKRAMKVFGYSITYLTVVFVAMAADILIYEGF